MKAIEEFIDVDNPKYEFAVVDLFSFQVVKSFVCNDNEHLMREMEKIKSEGGIGVILRKPGTLYFEDSSYYKFLVNFH